MSAFPKFDPWSNSAGTASRPAKLANPAKAPVTDLGNAPQFRRFSGFSSPDPATAGPPNVPQAWIDGHAKLEAMRAPSSVPTLVWWGIVATTGGFLADWGEIAARLGWDQSDVFGCHRLKPYDRFECQGLVWALPERKLVALTALEAVLRTKSGAMQRHRRPASGKGSVESVLIWELGAD